MTYAYLNHGRWVVDCPADYCYAAYKVVGSALRCRCENDDTCGHVGRCRTPIHIAFPDDAAEIKRITDLRPDRATRNWYPGETTDQLVAENMEHGVVST